MNIEERLREIIREELRPVLAALKAASIPGRPMEATALTVARQRAALPPIDPRQWLTTTEAALLLGLKPQTLANWRALTKGPEYRRVGRAVRYDRAVIEAYGVEREE